MNKKRARFAKRAILVTFNKDKVNWKESSVIPVAPDYVMGVDSCYGDKVFHCVGSNQQVYTVEDFIDTYGVRRLITILEEEYMV